MTGVQQINNGPAGEFKTNLHPQDQRHHNQQDSSADTILADIGQLLWQSYSLETPYDAGYDKYRYKQSFYYPSLQGQVVGAFRTDVARYGAIHAIVRPLEHRPKLTSLELKQNRSRQ